MEISTFCKVQTKLMVEEKYNVTHAAIMTADIFNYYDETIKNAVIDWASGKDVTSIVLGEYSVEDIMTNVGCSAFHALCILQAIKVNPDSFVDAVLVMEVE